MLLGFVWQAGVFGVLLDWSLWEIDGDDLGSCIWHLEIPRGQNRLRLKKSRCELYDLSLFMLGCLLSAHSHHLLVARSGTTYAIKSGVMARKLAIFPSMAFQCQCLWSVQLSTVPSELWRRHGPFCVVATRRCEPLLLLRGRWGRNCGSPTVHDVSLGMMCGLLHQAVLPSHTRPYSFSVA